MTNLPAPLELQKLKVYPLAQRDSRAVWMTFAGAF